MTPTYKKGRARDAQRPQSLIPNTGAARTRGSTITYHSDGTSTLDIALFRVPHKATARRPSPDRQGREHEHPDLQHR